jgi:hypothetical protein
MSRYQIICRLRWPALLLLTGVIALLDQANILSWGRAWPLYLILWGVLALAERATLASEMPPAGAYPYAAAYPGYPAQPVGYPAPSAPPAAPVAEATTGIVPTHGEIDSLAKEPRKSWDEEGR